MKKVALVTGGSRGIGAAIVKSLAEDHAVCINYQSSKDQANELANLIQKQQGIAIAVPANIRSEQEIIELFNIVDHKFGPITTLINNAGVTGVVGELVDNTFDNIHNIFATNVFSTFITCREAIKRMKNHGGNIVNITSEAAKYGGNKIAAYASSKAAINTLTIGLAREVAKYNIRVNAVSPGVIDTEMQQNASRERIQQLINAIPMGRMGNIDEVASLVKWLVSEKASYISGAIIPVAGGR